MQEAHAVEQINVGSCQEIHAVEQMEGFECFYDCTLAIHVKQFLEKAHPLLHDFRQEDNAPSKHSCNNN